MIIDNRDVNRKIGRDYANPLLGCLNHKLNLQINKVVPETPDRDAQLDALHRTMVSASNYLKSDAVLCSLKDLHVVTPNETSCSGKYFMLHRFVRMRDDFIKASDMEECSITINRKPQFLSKIQKKHSDSL